VQGAAVMGSPTDRRFLLVAGIAGARKSRDGKAPAVVKSKGSKSVAGRRASVMCVCLCSRRSKKMVVVVVGGGGL
jgi:hypothetical protein